MKKINLSQEEDWILNKEARRKERRLSSGNKRKLAKEAEPTRAESIALLEAAARALAMEGLEEGGAGSGNWGHAGVPGSQGGSMPSRGPTARSDAGGYGVAMSTGDKAKTARARWEKARGAAGAKPEGPQVFFDYQTAPTPTAAVAAKTIPAGDKTLKPTDYHDIEGKRLDIPLGTARQMARGAYNSIRSGDAKGMTLDNEKGHAEAIVAYKDEDDVRPGKYLYIDYLASGIKGGGTRLVAEVCRQAAKNGRGVSLSAIPTSASFYQKIGMKRIRDGGSHYSDTTDYAFSQRQATAFANQVLGV